LWLQLTTEGNLHAKALKFVKKVGVIYTVPILLLLVLMGLNNESSSIFNGELYLDYPVLFVLPFLLVASAIATMVFGYKEKGIHAFITSLSTMFFFVMVGFVGMFPYVLISRGAVNESLLIRDTMAGAGPLKIILIAVAIFYPIIIGYQGWKFKRFTKKVKYNDEE